MYEGRRRRRALVMIKLHGVVDGLRFHERVRVDKKLPVRVWPARLIRVVPPPPLIVLVVVARGRGRVGADGPARASTRAVPSRPSLIPLPLVLVLVVLLVLVLVRRYPPRRTRVIIPVVRIIRLLLLLLVVVVVVVAFAAVAFAAVLAAAVRPPSRAEPPTAADAPPRPTRG